jgi:hypothetical protein
MAGLMSIESRRSRSRPARVARQATIELQAIVALKGALTFIASPRLPAMRNPSLLICSFAADELLE